MLLDERVRLSYIQDYASGADFGQALKGVDVVIHLAGRAHMTDESPFQALDEYRKINVDYTLNLANQAVNAGVKRFIYISSIKVNGEFNRIDTPFTADDMPKPSTAYGISKYEAELGLLMLSKKNKMEVVIIRPPLVYGPGVKGNFLKMISLISMSIPLPLGGIKTKRSIVFIDNLVNLLLVCIQHPDAANQVFLVSDGVDISVSQLLIRLGSLMGSAPKIFSLPASIIKFLLILIGQRAMVRQLLLPLQVDIDKTCCVLGWAPAISVDDGLRKTIQDL